MAAVDARGVIVGTSRRAFVALRQHRGLAGLIREAVRAKRAPIQVRLGGVTLHLSPCDDPTLRTGWLVTVDGASFAEPPTTLTARQEELLTHLEKGLTNAEIGAAMGIARATVKTTLERLYRQAEVTNRVELLAWARARPTRPSTRHIT